MSEDAAGSREFTGLMTHFVLMTQHPNAGDLITFKPENVSNLITREAVQEKGKASGKGKK